MWMTTAKSTPTSHKGVLRNLVKHFAKDEDGALTIFGLYILVVMIMIGGIATDIMRHDTIYSELQGTADRAALAAADLDQPLEPEDVVADYFDKAGLTQYLKTPVSAPGGLNWQEVTVEAEATMSTYFMHWSGIKTLPIKVKSVAEERVSDIEISLVVDVSGSMGSNSRLTNLKTAASSFFDAVIKNTTDPLEGMTSVSIIPYHSTVNAGPLVLDHYNPTNHHNYSHCINFSQSAFNTPALSTTDQLDRVAHFSIGSENDDVPDWWDYRCWSETALEIMPFSMDKTALKAKINGLSADGWTAVDVGMKWGAALLDPSALPMVSALAAQNKPGQSGTNAEKEVSPFFANRPVNYDSLDNMKVIVMMTDGVNTDQYDLKSEFKTGDSPVYYSATEDEYAVYVASRSSNKWYYPDGYTFYNNRGKKRTKSRHSSPPAGAVPVSYVQLYHDWAIDDAADKFFKNASNDLYDEHEEDGVLQVISENGSDGRADTNLNNICNAVKNENVVVFAIAFEAPTSAQNKMRSCASSDGHFFDVDGTDITNAFRSIASQINRLRLTQ